MNNCKARLGLALPLAVSILSAGWLFGTATAQSSTTAPLVDITGYTVSGSHCRIGKDVSDTTIMVKNSLPGGSRDYFQLTFDAFILQPGQYGNPKNVAGLYGDCLVDMQVTVPKGYQISYVRYELDGDIQIGQFADEDGRRGEESAEITTAFYLETAGPERKWLADGRHSVTRRGSVAEEVEVLEDIGLVAESCTERVNLSVYTTATLESDTIIDSESQVSVDRSSGNQGQIIRLYLSPCAP